MQGKWDDSSSDDLHATVDNLIIENWFACIYDDIHHSNSTYPIIKAACKPSDFDGREYQTMSIHSIIFNMEKSRMSVGTDVSTYT